MNLGQCQASNKYSRESCFQLACEYLNFNKIEDASLLFPDPNHLSAFKDWLTIKSKISHGIISPTIVGKQTKKSSKLFLCNINKGKSFIGSPQSSFQQLSPLKNKMSSTPQKPIVANQSCQNDLINMRNPFQSNEQGNGTKTMTNNATSTSTIIQNETSENEGNMNDFKYAYKNLIPDDSVSSASGSPIFNQRRKSSIVDPEILEEEILKCINRYKLRIQRVYQHDILSLNTEQLVGKIN